MKRFFKFFNEFDDSFVILIYFLLCVLVLIVFYFLSRSIGFDYYNSHYFVEIQLDSSTTVYGKSCGSNWGHTLCYGFDDTVYTSFISYTWRSKEDYDLLFP